MLPWAARPAEPSVVRHVYDQARPTSHEFTDEFGENPLVTDYDGERGWRAREDARAGARLEFGDELGPAPDESDQSRQRHELSERDELDLIIPPDNPTFSQEKRAVIQLGRSRSISIYGAQEQWGVDGPGHGRQSSQKVPITAEHCGDSRLGLHDQIGVLGTRPLCQGEVNLDRLRGVVGLELQRLLDRWLHDGHPGLVRGQGSAQAPDPKAQRTAEHRPGERNPAEGRTPREDETARERGVHRDDHERDPVDASELGDLDDGQAQVLRVAENAPGEATEEMTANPLPAHPQERRRAESPGDRASRQPRHGGGEDPDI